MEMKKPTIDKSRGGWRRAILLYRHFLWLQEFSSRRLVGAYDDMDGPCYSKQVFPGLGFHAGWIYSNGCLLRRRWRSPGLSRVKEQRRNHGSFIMSTRLSDDYYKSTSLTLGFTVLSLTLRRSHSIQGQ